MLLEKAYQYIQSKTAKSNNSSQIFIIPTSIGAYYFTTAVLQLIMGVIFSNNLILLFGLLLLIFGILTAVVTNFHLENIELLDIRVSSGHQNSVLTYAIQVKNRLKKQELSGVNFKVILTNKEVFHIQGKNLVPDLQTVSGEHKLPRGKYEIAHIITYTNYPLNLFESWKVRQFQHKKFYVYPLRIKTIDAQKLTANVETIKGKPIHASEFSHIEKYQDGEPLNRIDWKIFARTHELHKRVFQHNQNSERKFTLVTPTTERHLSEISSLITSAFENGHQWELETSDQIFPMGQGQSHYEYCQMYLSQKVIHEKISG